MSRGDEQPFDALAHALDALDNRIQTSDATVRRSERNRLSLLHVHALFAVIIAPLFALLGRDGMNGPSWIIARLIPGAPYTLAVLLGIGGVILGVATWYRRVGWELIGLWVLMSWYTIIAVSFAGALLWWLTGGQSGPRPSPYPAAVYTHVCVILGIHQMTLVRIRRSRRKAAR